MANSFWEGLFSGFGYLVAALIMIGVCYLLYRMIPSIANSIEKRGMRARFVIDNWDRYIRSGYFEELAILSKYRPQLEKGEWPMDLEGMFEWVNTDKKVATNRCGDLVYFNKSILTLKNKYKRQKAKQEAKNEQEANKDKDNK